MIPTAKLSYLAVEDYAVGVTKWLYRCPPEHMEEAIYQPSYWEHVPGESIHPSMQPGDIITVTNSEGAVLLHVGKGMQMRAIGRTAP